MTTSTQSEGQQFFPGINRSGQVRMTLAVLDTDTLVNYRKTANEESIQKYCSSLKMNGNGEQLQAIVGYIDEKTGKIVVYIGFTRVESMRRNALANLVKEYNNTFGYKPEDEGYVHNSETIVKVDSKKIKIFEGGFETEKQRQRIRNHSEEWRTRYDAALANYPVDINLRPVASEDEAKLSNVASNMLVTEVGLMDQAEAIAELSKVFSGNKIAAELGITGGQVSHYKKVYASPGMLKDLFDDARANHIITEEDRQLCHSLIEEYVRRLNLPKDNPSVIKFSHAREFANAVFNKKHPMNVKSVILLMKSLCCVGTDNKFRPEESTMDYGRFTARINDIKKAGDITEAQSKAEAASAPSDPGTEASEAAKAAVKAAMESGVASSANAGAVDPVTVDDLAKEQQAAHGTSEIVPPKEGEYASSVTDETPDTPADITDIADTEISDVDGLEFAEADLADVDEDPSDEDLAAVEDLTAPGDDDDFSDVLAGNEDLMSSGAKSTKTVSTTGSSELKAKDPIRIAQDARLAYEASKADGVHPTEVIANLQTAAHLYECVGLMGPYEQLQQAFIEYSIEYQEYLDNVFSQLKSALSADDYKTLVESAPPMPVVEL